MEWRDEGLVLAVRPHGESSAILDMFTPDHGRHLGVLRGGQSRRMAPMLQPGNQLDLTWRARLDDHMGLYAAEPLLSRSALLESRLALAGLNAVVALLLFSLPERDPHPDLYRASLSLLDRIGAQEDWAVDYLLWERALLDEMGYGLDLDSCAVTGRGDDLRFVSPKSGRAVSGAGAGAWADRLLPLPACLRTGGPATAADLAAGLATTGHFLLHRLAADLGRPTLPDARQRLVTALLRDK